MASNFCDRCGTKVGFFSMRHSTPSGYLFCQKCTPVVEKEVREKEREKEESERQRLKQLKPAADKIIVTTTPSIDGYHVRKYLGVESV